ncbi:benzoate/H(+) symporter BenE family transporter [Alcaligenes sp. Marseille-Q7550]
MSSTPSSSLPPLHRLLSWFQISHMSAGLIAVLVGYTSSAAIVFQAAQAAGASTEELGSWMWAIGIGLGFLSCGLSLRYKIPILTAWSTPGAALLATGLVGLPMSQAIGIFLFSSLLTTLCGLTGSFQKLMQYMPRSIAGAMLGGILLRFGLDLFGAMQTQWLMCIAMFVVFLLARQWFARYAVPLALLCGVLIAALQGLLKVEVLSWTPAKPVFTWPEFSWTALLGVGIPFFIVTMSSQNVPGVAVLKAHNYDAPNSTVISWTGIMGLILGPFGGYAYNLAAISAALCMTPEVDPDPRQRYRASVWAGLFYFAGGIFGATVVSLFAAFPTELIAAIAGLALLGTIGNSIHMALEAPDTRDAALVTFLTTASGMSLLNIGSAFWGLVFGMAIYLIQKRKPA